MLGSAAVCSSDGDGLASSKAAMAMMVLLEPVWRLPMFAPKPESMKKIEAVLDTAGLLTDRSVRVAS